MHLDPIFLTLTAIICIVTIVGLLLQLARQPQVIGYLFVGIIIGPFGFDLIADRDFAERLGNFGVVLLMFFVGMEVVPRQLLSSWRIAIVGTILQVSMSVLLVWMVGIWFDWPMARIVLLGFVTSLSSTAVIVKLLRDSGEISRREGQDVLAILLTQDLFIVPMMVAIGFFGGQAVDWGMTVIQVAIAILIVLWVIWALSRPVFHMPFSRLMQRDRELEVFFALLICSGMAAITGAANLSTAFGAFIGGILVTAAHETHWVHKALEPFRILFVALFFISVGVMVDLSFIRAHTIQVISLVFAVLAGNTFLNGLILRVLGYSWKESVYAGAMLAQIGEFSFILAALGLQIGIISQKAYQYTIAVIALSLLISPFWIAGARRTVKVKHLAQKPMSSDSP